MPSWRWPTPSAPATSSCSNCRYRARPATVGCRWNGTSPTTTPLRRRWGRASSWWKSRATAIRTATIRSMQPATADIIRSFRRTIPAPFWWGRVPRRVFPDPARGWISPTTAKQSICKAVAMPWSARATVDSTPRRARMRGIRHVFGRIERLADGGGRGSGAAAGLPRAIWAARLAGHRAPDPAGHGHAAGRHRKYRTVPRSARGAGGHSEFPGRRRRRRLRLAGQLPGDCQCEPGGCRWRRRRRQLSGEFQSGPGKSRWRGIWRCLRSRPRR